MLPYSSNYGSKKLCVAITGNKPNLVNEICAYRELSQFTPPIIADTGDTIVCQYCKHNGEEIPEGYTKDQWVDKMISFWLTFTFSHNDPKICHIVYDNPGTLYVIDLELSTTSYLKYFDPNAKREFFSEMGSIPKSIELNLADFIISCLVLFYDYPDYYNDCHAEEKYDEIIAGEARPDLFELYKKLTQP